MIFERGDRVYLNTSLDARGNVKNRRLAEKHGKGPYTIIWHNDEEDLVHVRSPDGKQTFYWFSWRFIPGTIRLTLPSRTVEI